MNILLHRFIGALSPFGRIALALCLWFCGQPAFSLTASTAGAESEIANPVARKEKRGASISRGADSEDGGSLTARISADMLSANEVPPNTGDESQAAALAVITLTAARNLDHSIVSATVGLDLAFANFPPADKVISAQIHAGTSGNTGPLVFDSGITLVKLKNGAGETLVPEISIAPQLAEQIINDSGGFYFELGTTVSPGGALRGQLVTAQTEEIRNYSAQVSPANEIPPISGEASAISGTVNLALILTTNPGLNVLGSVDLSVIVTGLLPDDPVLGGEVRLGTAAQSGPVVIDFNVRGQPTANGVLAENLAILSIPVPVVQQIFDAPDSFYFEIQTQSAPNGAVRGQLVEESLPLPTREVPLSSVLTPTQETSIVRGRDKRAHMEALFLVDLILDPSGNIVDAKVSVFAEGIGYSGNEHFLSLKAHEGSAGETGPVAFPILSGPFPIAGRLDESQVLNIDVSPALAKQILDNPSQFYAEFETDRSPNGAARGQLVVPPTISGVQIQGKTLIVSGAGFQPGATLSIDFVPVVTMNDGSNPTAILISQKAAQLIPIGGRVSIEAVNPDGGIAAFLFQRSSVSNNPREFAAGPLLTQ